MSRVLRFSLASVAKTSRGAEVIAAGRVVGDMLELDYAVFAERFRRPSVIASTCLAGSELKALLGRLGINAEPGCACESRANEMDRNGCDWCEANIPTIVGWLREEATKRGLPFVDLAGTVLVRRAISNARRLHRGKA
jgi:hypothetical protein